MLRGSREDHLRFLLHWLEHLDATRFMFDLEVLGPEAKRKHQGSEVLAVRHALKDPDEERGRLLALIELDGLEAHVTFCRPEYLGLVRTAKARLQETLGGKP